MSLDEHAGHAGLVPKRIALVLPVCVCKRMQLLTSLGSYAFNFGGAAVVLHLLPFNVQMTQVSLTCFVFIYVPSVSLSRSFIRTLFCFHTCVFCVTLTSFLHTIFCSILVPLCSYSLLFPYVCLLCHSHIFHSYSFLFHTCRFVCALFCFHMCAFCVTLTSFIRTLLHRCPAFSMCAFSMCPAFWYRMRSYSLLTSINHQSMIEGTHLYKIRSSGWILRVADWLIAAIDS